MRIDIDEDLEKILDEIKHEKWIHGRGHTETVRYLAQKFREYESLEALIDKKLSKIQLVLEEGIRATFRKIINGLLQ